MPPQNPAPFRWNKAKTEAAKLLAEDELTDDEIAVKVGKNRWTLWTWKKAPEFAAKIKELAEQYGAAQARYAIAKRSRRVRWLNDRVERLHSVIRDRAADPSMQNVPGGPTGLMVRTTKSVGAGPAAQIVEEYEVDTGLLKELREHEKQAAVEVGQWTEKREHSISELDQLIAAELARLATRNSGDLPANDPAGAADCDAGTGKAVCPGSPSANPDVGTSEIAGESGD